MTTQLELPRYPDRPGYKRTGTSQEAAAAIKPRQKTLQAECLDALSTFGPSTADEVATILCKSILSIRPRMAELFKLGKIADTGARRRNASGICATVWQIA